MEKKKKILFIINPIAGTNSKAIIERNIANLIDKQKFDFVIRKTEAQGHATLLAKEAVKDKVDVVCAIGGDGTVNETAKGLLHSNTALAIIPCGSGNGLARHLQIPMDFTKAIKLINECNIHSIDYGLINNIPFLCTCGMGFDAFISYKFAHSNKRGPMKYIENILANGLDYHPETYEIEAVDENKLQTSYMAFLISCANASQYGNNAYIAPQASVRDGILDVTIIEPFTIVDAPTIALQLFNGTIDTNSRIKTLRCKKLKIKRAKEGVIHYDGEPVMTGADIEVSLVPKGLKCVCSSTEGPMQMTKNIQNFIIEQFNDLYYRTENIIENNTNLILKKAKKNIELVKKLGKKDNPEDGD